MTTPTGSPAHERTNSASTYGGHPLKQNYQAQGAVNPKTDVEAGEFLRICADLAAVSRTAAFCKLTLTTSDTAPADPTVNEIEQMHRTSGSGYPGATPSHASFPTCTRVSDGRVRCVWPISQSDEYGAAADLVLRFPHAEVINYSGFARVVYTIIDEQTIEFAALDDSNAAIQDVQMFIEVA